MSFFKGKWTGKSKQHNDDVQVVYTDNQDDKVASCSIEVSSKQPKEDAKEAIQEDSTDPQKEDQKALLSEIDQDGVVREYEVALKHLGFGFFHIILLFINGTALLSEAIEILSISFVLPVLNHPDEYGTGSFEDAILGSSIFIGMLFGSYLWGALADVIGRRTTIVASLTLSAIFGFSSAFSPWFWLFVLFRFFSGFGLVSSLSAQDLFLFTVVVLCVVLVALCL